jgi:hypothetical protein
MHRSCMQHQVISWCASLVVIDTDHELVEAGDGAAVLGRRDLRQQHRCDH